MSALLRRERLHRGKLYENVSVYCLHFVNGKVAKACKEIIGPFLNTGLNCPKTRKVKNGKSQIFCLLRE